MNNFLEQLKELCLNYDRLHGEYPESCLEGKALYEEAVWNLDSDEMIQRLLKEYNEEIEKSNIPILGGT